MLIICHPSILSNVVLVNPRALWYNISNPERSDKRHPSLSAVHQIVCSVAKEVDCNFVGCQERWPGLWLVWLC